MYGVTVPDMFNHPNAYRPEFGWLTEHPAPYYTAAGHFYVSVLWFMPDNLPEPNPEPTKLRHYETFDEAVLAYRKERKRRAKSDRPTRGKLMLYLTEKGEAHYKGSDPPSCVGEVLDL